ncbi:hypothetical protein [Rhizobium sp. J15]|nr:hypothetical protein [Rhizobium sp. J15]
MPPFTQPHPSPSHLISMGAGGRCHSSYSVPSKVRRNGDRRRKEFS